MINTLNIKQAQLKNGFFTVGSGEEVMLILGSCRVAPYLNYFNRWNLENGNRFTIHSLDPFNFNWDENDGRVDYEVALKVWETDERMLSMFKSVDIFIHEWYNHAEMFNCNKACEKNIYQYGMLPAKDICIPNYNDYFILVNDILAFDTGLRKKAIQDLNVIHKLSEQTQKEIFEVSKRNLNNFYDVCRLSDIPEMEDYFSSRIKRIRQFHSYNHISKDFSLGVFYYINEKFLKLQLSQEFWDEISKEDMFANSFTKLTEYDIKFYGFDWGEEIVPLFS